MTEFEIILLLKLEEKDHLILSMRDANSSPLASVDTMAATTDDLNKTIAELNQTIATLKEQLHKNSSNSSKPSSSNGYGKPPASKSLRGKSEKNQAGRRAMKKQTLYR